MKHPTSSFPAPTAGPGWWRLLSVICVALALGACFPLRPMHRPVATLDLSVPSAAEMVESPGSGAGGEGPCAVVFLPGAFDRPATFEREGFDHILAERSPQVRSLAVDLHLRYYIRGKALRRLDEDVVTPLRQEGYRVWLVGISMGGMGAALYASQVPGYVAPTEGGPDRTLAPARPEATGTPEGEVAGMVLMAPFLGDDEIIEAVDAAGGPLRWQPENAPAGRRGRGTVGYDLWPWFARWHEARQAGEDGWPEVVLAYGRADDFAPAGEQLASLLDEERVFTHPAGHDWDAWTPLWREIVASGIFDACGPPPGGGAGPA
ncbi:MAG: alpha/beta hydrolase [Holophagales bacterium]|nr:alpha/beta hydrolase [Holophagales bacterium]